jgi:hypothetical protein
MIVVPSLLFVVFFRGSHTSHVVVVVQETALDLSLVLVGSEYQLCL